MNRKVRNAKKVYNEHGEKIADSRWEARVLWLLEREKLNFTTQKRFEILPALKTHEGKTFRKRFWIPDFVFENEKVIIDAKGFCTEMARIKIHLFSVKYPEYLVFTVHNYSDLEKAIAIIKKGRKR